MLQHQWIPILLLSFISIGLAQNSTFYFPEDALEYSSSAGNRAEISQNIVPETKKGTVYDQYVNQIISGGIARLTLGINKALLNKRTGKYTNVVFAPMSIGGALGLVLLGSNGKTFAEITTVLGLATGLDIVKKSEKVHEQFGNMITKLEATSGFDLGQEVSFAHAIFVESNYPIRNLYRQAAEHLYQSDIFSVDFSNNPSNAQQLINGWVRGKTRGKIKDILADVPSSVTKVIIASAMYFKATWEKPFFEGSTTRRPFYKNGRDFPALEEVLMMANGGTFPYYRDLKLQCEILGFPYRGNATIMYVVMPFGSSTEKLKQFENSLAAKDLEDLADSTTPTNTVVLFPKMTIESTIDLKAPLKELGLSSLFNPAEANLALLSSGKSTVASIPKSNPGFGMQMNARISSSKKDTLDGLRELINQQSTDNSYQNPGLYADKVIHKVYMDITETGTEAAATTSISLSRDGGRVTFRVDVPFLFFIRHEETKTILFWGSVNTPTPNFSIH